MTIRISNLDPNPIGKPAVLMLHGLGANSSSWTLQFEALIALGFRPIAVDLPGFGKTIYDGRGWNFKRITKDLADWVKDLHIGRVHVVGLSMGGVVAQQFVLDYPELIRKLILVSTFAVLRPSSVSQWYYFVRRAIIVHTFGISIQAKLVAKHVFPEPDQDVLRKMAEQQILTADPRAYRAAMRCLGFFDSRGRLEEIKTPTLIVSGANDTTVPVFHQTILAEKIFGAKQVIIPGAGHAASIDQFEAFNTIMLKFLEE